MKQTDPEFIYCMYRMCEWMNSQYMTISDTPYAILGVYMYPSNAIDIIIESGIFHHLTIEECEDFVKTFFEVRSTLGSINTMIDYINRVGAINKDIALRFIEEREKLISNDPIETNAIDKFLKKSE